MSVTEIRRLVSGDEDRVREAAALFDHAPRPDATRRFLASADHHLLVAYASGEPAGFVTGVELTHPDKGTEMFLYELGVAQRFRRKGIGTMLVAALRDLAVERGCYGMWVLTDRSSDAALATYRAAGAREQRSSEMLAWTFSDDQSR